jgi:hypothetical protein
VVGSTPPRRWCCSAQEKARQRGCAARRNFIVCPWKVWAAFMGSF